MLLFYEVYLIATISSDQDEVSESSGSSEEESEESGESWDEFEEKRVKNPSTVFIKTRSRMKIKTKVKGGGRISCYGHYQFNVLVQYNAFH
ncbi:unnamed protein product [Rhizophagus irregularis]|nr:unnamed protein product [Rhizophagus irregularis]